MYSALNQAVSIHLLGVERQLLSRHKVAGSDARQFVVSHIRQLSQLAPSSGATRQPAFLKGLQGFCVSQRGSRLGHSLKPNDLRARSQS
jgi:hypothetical protein